jgi:hypothetical protein
VYALVDGRGVEPERVADRFDLDLADVYHAFAYYHDHPREMSEVDAEREEAMAAVRESVPLTVCRGRNRGFDHRTVASSAERDVVPRRSPH